jgi:hypothetical protein
VSQNYRVESRRGGRRGRRIVDRRLEVFTSPVSGAYQTSQVFGPADRVPLLIAGAQAAWISAADLLT